MKLFIRPYVFLLSIFALSSCQDGSINRHQYKLDYSKSAWLTVVCDNCSYYLDDNVSDVRTTIIEREIDSDALDLLSSIKFCGKGDTTPDGWLQIKTDKGSIANIGLLFPIEGLDSSLRIQTSETGLGRGCTKRDQEKFEAFFNAFADKPS
jgi:hypothetical protein